MKITAGMGNLDDYIPFAQAGADEVFCGYVPRQWAERYGMMVPFNRREVLYYNVQIGSRSELQILNGMQKDVGVPVTIAINGLYYTPEQYPIIAEIINQCMQDGFFSFILADPALLIYLNQQGFHDCRFHISGEMSEVNHNMINWVRGLQAQRIIFHRKNTIESMKQCIVYDKAHYETNIEYEAFFLNEMCHFTGAFCNSLHCDELSHICHLPYQLSGMRAVRPEVVNEDQPYSIQECIGATGCGLCALWQMKNIGITNLKLVGRGNYTEKMLRDIELVKKAITIMNESKDEREYLEQMKQQLFPKGCSGTCYYRECSYVTGNVMKKPRI